jgi:hypothetical protein
MATAIFGRNVSSAWLEAYALLIERGRDVVNLVVAIEKPLVEDSRIRLILDRFIEERRIRNRNGAHRVELVSTVANTIFPQALYIPRLGRKARSHLYEMSELGRDASRRRNRRGTYFERLVAWPTSAGSINQLENVILRIQKAQSRGRYTENALELAVSGVSDFVDDVAREKTAGLAIYGTEFDKGITRGFPCLSHISLSLVDGQLHMTALYRNHEFVRRAYGNYLGLGRLLGFVAHEAGCGIGELMCVCLHMRILRSVMARVLEFTR